MKPSKGHLVSLSNRLVNAPFSIRVSIHVLRIVLMAVSRLDSRKRSDEQNTVITITPAEYAEMYSISTGNAYKILSDNAGKLTQLASFVDNNGNLSELPWFKLSHYSKAKVSDQVLAQVLTLSFSKIILSELTGLSEKFTSIRIEHLKRLSNPRSIFLYMHASRAHKQAEYYRKRKCNKSTVKIELSFYRGLLGLDDKYKGFKEFKRRILSPAVQEINESTDIEISVEPVRTGRFITAMNIEIHDLPAHVRAKRELDLHKSTRERKSSKKWKSERAALIEEKLTSISEGPDELYVAYLEELADLHHSLGKNNKVRSIEGDISAIRARHDNDYLMDEGSGSYDMGRVAI